MTAKRARNRVLKVTVKVRDPEDLKAILDALDAAMPAIETELVIELQSDAAVDTEPDTPIVVDEQLETAVVDEARERLELLAEAAKEAKAAEAEGPTPTDIVAKRGSLAGQVKAAAKEGYGFTVERVAKGVADSLKG